MRALLVMAILSIGSPIVAGEIADLQQRTPQDSLRMSAPPRVTPSSGYTHGITEIGIERTGCRGTCPAYTFIASVDGRVRYKGEKHADREGTFAGEIHGPYFHQLAQLIKDSDFMDLDDVYTCDVTDLPATYTMVVLNGERKIVRNYGNSGPSKLWAIEELIDGLRAQTDWAQKSQRGKRH